MSDFERNLAAAKAGDEVAFASLFRSTQPLLLRYLRTVGGPLAEDCAAETWVGVVSGLDRFDGDESDWRAWVVTIGRRRLIDAQRKQGRAETLSDFPEDLEESRREPAPDVAALVEESQATSHALAMLADLPPEQREAVFLRHVVGLDVKQTAELVRRSPGSVRVATHRGLRRLEVLLASSPAPSLEDERP